MYFWAVFFHILFIAFWLGGMLFTAAVLVPATRGKLSDIRGLLFTELGTRFSRLSWILFPLILITGILALFGKGYRTEMLLTSEFWFSTPYGSRLMSKLGLFSLVMILSGIHDFWLGPKAADLMERNPDDRTTKNFRKATSWIGRINLILALFILFLAVGLVRP